MSMPWFRRTHGKHIGLPRVFAPLLMLCSPPQQINDLNHTPGTQLSSWKRVWVRGDSESIVASQRSQDPWLKSLSPCGPACIRNIFYASKTTVINKDSVGDSCLFVCFGWCFFDFGFLNILEAELINQDRGDQGGSMGWICRFEVRTYL